MKAVTTTFFIFCMILTTAAIAEKVPPMAKYSANGKIENNTSFGLANYDLLLSFGVTNKSYDFNPYTNNGHTSFPHLSGGDYLAPLRMDNSFEVKDAVIGDVNLMSGITASVTLIRKSELEPNSNEPEYISFGGVGIRRKTYLTSVLKNLRLVGVPSHTVRIVNEQGQELSDEELEKNHFSYYIDYSALTKFGSSPDAFEAEPEGTKTTMKKSIPIVKQNQKIPEFYILADKRYGVMVKVIESLNVDGFYSPNVSRSEKFENKESWQAPTTTFIYKSK